MNSNNSLFSVANTYLQMREAAAPVVRPNWVPSSISEKHVPAFVKAVIEARVNKKKIVEFNQKKYLIREEDPEQQAADLAKETEKLEAEGDAASIKHDNVADKQAEQDTIENKPEEVKEEDSSEIQASNETEKKAEEDSMDTLPAMAEDTDENGDDDEEEHDEDEIDHAGDEDEDDWKSYDGDNDEDDQIEDEPKDQNPGEGETFDGKIEEKLTASDPAGKWISDFVKSKNPKFAGKSKEQRRKMAIGAYYGAQREATEYQPGLKSLMSVADAYKQMNAPAAAAAPKPLRESVAVKENAEANETDKVSADAHAATAAAKGTKNHELHAKARDAHIAAGKAQLEAGNLELAGEHLRHAQGHDFMHHRYSSGQQVHEGTHNDAKAGPEVLDAGTAKMKAGHKDVKVEDRFNVGAAQDGSDKLVPSEKPAVDAKSGAETPATPDPELETPKTAETGAEKVGKASLPANADPKAPFPNPVIQNPTGAEGISQASVPKTH